MTDGIQETVRQGLVYLAGKVAEGAYGEGDDAFGGEDDELGQAFLEDMHDHVIDKME